MELSWKDWTKSIGGLASRGRVFISTRSLLQERDSGDGVLLYLNNNCVVHFLDGAALAS